MRTRPTLSSLLPLMCLAISGCGLTLGPQAKTEIVIVEPGRPVEILQQTGKIRCRQVGDQTPVLQDVGGWIAMPMAHWAVVKAALEKGPPLKAEAEAGK